MVILISLFIVAWVAAGVLGSLTYFLGEQSKPIHERNWRSTSFAKLSQSLTGLEIDYSTRVPAFAVGDAYSSSQLPDT